MINKELLQQDGIIYYIHIILFSLFFIYKPQWAPYGIAVLLILLVFSFFLIPQRHSKRNKVRFKHLQITNFNALLLLLLFGNLLLLHWSTYLPVEKAYLLTFITIQLLSIRIQKILD